MLGLYNYWPGHVERRAVVSLHTFIFSLDAIKNQFRSAFICHVNVPNKLKFILLPYCFPIYINAISSTIKKSLNDTNFSKMMMNLSMKRNGTQRRGSKRREQREEYTLPHLIKSPTCSTTSSDDYITKTNKGSPTSPYSSSSRMQKRFSDLSGSARRRLSTTRDSNNQQQHRHQHQHRHNSLSTKSSRSIEDPHVFNNSIHMGASIIKRQLSSNSNGIDSPTRSSRDFHRNNHQNNDDDDDDDDEWSPWKTENDARNKQNDNGNENENNNNDHDLDDDDDDDDDTLVVLEKAKAIISSRSDLTDKNYAHSNLQTPPPPMKEKGNHATNDEKENNMKNCMVQRLSETDNSTFASSTSGGNDGGYLPTYLASGFVACGSGQDENAAPESPRPLYTNNKEDDALETSTLDFLANLHVEEEELNLIFNSFEEKQQELCAQSNRHSSSAAAAAAAAAVHHRHQKSSRTSGNSSGGNIMTSLMCSKKSSPPSPTTSATSSAAFRVTNAAVPFEKMIPPRSSFFDELRLKSPSYRHALNAGLLWQSLASQHVRFSGLWWDGEEPARPPFGSSKKKPWAYLGRHRVQGDYKLNSLIGNRGSSGRILLHLVVRDVVSLEPIEDICCGCFHPNARGIRTTKEYNPRSEDCRDVWIAHRRRAQEKRLLVQEDDSDADSDTDSDDEYAFTTIESLLRHQNKNRVDPSPLGAQGGKSAVSNDNIKFVFGSKPPVYTVFVLESDLYELFQNKLDGSIPASVVLLRHYLKYRIG
jgi:hypothetical protein